MDARHEHDDLPPAAYAAALASLTEMGPARLRGLLGLAPAPELWVRLESGTLSQLAGVRALLGPDTSSLAATWAELTRAADPGATWAACSRADVGVLVLGEPSYPAGLADDPAAPPILFTRGDPDVIAGTRVGIVGTRRCTRYGVEIADELGFELSRTGVSVVSGLALGIDGAAHAGALRAEAAPPVAVVGSGCDVPYPRRHRALWHDVADAGVILSEYPPGAEPDAWHFPQRNRIIAALSDALVVVESNVAGGSLITAELALARDVPVFAVPGPIRSASSAGTNRLIADGAHLFSSVDDVLLCIGSSPSARRSSAETRPAPSPRGALLLDALGWQPRTVGQLARRCPSLSRREVAVELELLAADRWVAAEGAWYERVARAPDPPP